MTNTKPILVALSRELLEEVRDLVEIRNDDPDYLEENGRETLEEALLDVLDRLDDEPGLYSGRIAREIRSLTVALGIAEAFDPSRVVTLGGRSPVWFRLNGTPYQFAKHVHPSTFRVLDPEGATR